ncbi:hypothetical protein [Rhizobium alvei]|uniref:Uncharacterized protein n=1 Tax=Rhizobium alvei TaxID=1132659 RepID=A0ABT8YSY3_9HYPH|nr:hypothetical protein [Rhizobium alvei]MDO6966457.1 hypothetical protein [Rhizobium alvei]
MSNDFDLSLFRLVKSFAAIEISRNVVSSGPGEAEGAPADQPARPHDTALSTPAVGPGVSVAAGNPAPSNIDHIPDRLDDDMRAALDQGLEGAEREAVRWPSGPRNAALSLAGLARPGGSPDGRQTATVAPGQPTIQEPGTGSAASTPNDHAPLTRPAMQAAQALVSAVAVELAAAEPQMQSNTDAALPDTGRPGLPVLTTDAALALQAFMTMETLADETSVAPLPVQTVTPGDPAPDGEMAAGGGSIADPAAAKRGGTALEKPQTLLASAVSLFGEAQAVDTLQSIVEGNQRNRPQTSATHPQLRENGQILLNSDDEPVQQNTTVRDRDPARLSRPSIAGASLEAEQAEVPDGRSGDDARLISRQTAGARLLLETAEAARSMEARAHTAELPVAGPLRPPSEAHGEPLVPAEATERSGLESTSPASDGSEVASAGFSASNRPAVALSGAKVLEILDALVALAPPTEGGEDWKSFSSVILNAAMIPGWPPPRLVENPAAAEQADALVQLAETTEANEAPMTPEQLLAYLVSIGANLRLLRALQELVSRVEKKNGPALLAWLAGLVSALKLLEKSLKDVLEDGMDIPEWLAELADAAKRPRRRKQFHI